MAWEVLHQLYHVVMLYFAGRFVARWWFERRMQQVRVADAARRLGFKEADHG